MNRIVFVIGLLIAATSLAAKQTTDTDREHTKWIAPVMDSINTIEPGMTREDLLKVSTTEGGLSSRLRRTYVYKECPYIKVTVEFDAAENPIGGLTEMPGDKIVKVSEICNIASRTDYYAILSFFCISSREMPLVSG